MSKVIQRPHKIGVPLNAKTKNYVQEHFEVLARFSSVGVEGPTEGRIMYQSNHNVPT